MPLWKKKVWTSYGVHFVCSHCLRPDTKSKCVYRIHIISILGIPCETQVEIWSSLSTCFPLVKQLSRHIFGRRTETRKYFKPIIKCRIIPKCVDGKVFLWPFLITRNVWYITSKMLLRYSIPFWKLFLAQFPVIEKWPEIKKLLEPSCMYVQVLGTTTMWSPFYIYICSLRFLVA